MKLKPGTWTAAALLLAACGGEPRENAAAASADSTSVPAPRAAARTDSGAAPAPVPSMPQLPAAATAPPPTPEDSAAAAREDVSPEWKQRERSMASYTQCMEQARSAENALQARLEEACGRLPGAPK
jgi:hypothetical protein